MKWKLSPPERGALRKRLQATDDARECRRCCALLQLDRGLAVSDVAREFGVSRQTLYNWSHRFRKSASQDLRDRDREGRPTVWTGERTQKLELALDAMPREFGFEAVGWTAELLQTYLNQELGFDVSLTSIRRQLHTLDYVWKRHRYILAPDPQREKKNGVSVDASTTCRQEPLFCSRTKPT
jgi:transposase